MLAVLGEAAHGEPTLPQAAPQTHSTVRLPQEYSGCSMPSPVSCNDLLRLNMQIWTSGHKARCASASWHRSVSKAIALAANLELSEHRSHTMFNYNPLQQSFDQWKRQGGRGLSQQAANTQAEHVRVATP